MEIQIVDRDGRKRVLEIAPNQVLMDALRDLPFGVDALCGGNLACATCHVYLDSAGTELPPPSTAERAMLGQVPSVRPTSRLSCQIYVMQAFAGTTVEIAPVA